MFLELGSLCGSSFEQVSPVRGDFGFWKGGISGCRGGGGDDGGSSIPLIVSLQIGINLARRSVDEMLQQSMTHILLRGVPLVSTPVGERKEHSMPPVDLASET